jgi:hypothetical protein
MGIWDPINQFPGDAAFAVNGWLASWKAAPIVKAIDPWWRPGDLTHVIPGAKLVSRAPIPIHKPGLEPWAGAWTFSKNSGLYISCRRAMWQKGTKINMMEAAEFDVTSFDMAPETMAIEIGNNPAYALVACLNGCYSGTPQDAAGNQLPAQLKVQCWDQVYGGNGTVGSGTGTNGSGTLAVKSGDTAHYKPVNPARDAMGASNGWYNAHENFDFQNAQSYVPVLENLATRKAMNDVELGLAQNGGLELWISFQNYERTRLLLEVFEQLAGSGIATPYVVQSGVNNTGVNSLVKSYNDQVLFGQQPNPVYGRMKVRGITGLRTDLAVITAPRPVPRPEYSLFLYAQGGQTGQWALQTNPAAMQADTVPHIAVFPWTDTTGPMFFGTGGNSAGDIGLSMVVNEGFAAVSGLLTEFLFSGSAS